MPTLNFIYKWYILDILFLVLFLLFNTVWFTHVDTCDYSVFPFIVYNIPLNDYTTFYLSTVFDGHCRCSSIFGKPNLHFHDYRWGRTSFHVFIDHLCFLFCEMRMCPDIFPLQIQALLFSCSLSLEDHLDRRLQCPQASILVHPMGNYREMLRFRKKREDGDTLAPSLLADCRLADTLL